MGVGIPKVSSSSFDRTSSRSPSSSRAGYAPPASSPVSGNPDPANYRVLKVEEYGKFLLVKINYPDCKNYEGNKVLLFRDVTPADLLMQRHIDPHFCESTSEFKHPIARFAPTDEGWAMALDLINVYDYYSGGKDHSGGKD
jgi:hypothetical protein